VLDVGWVVNAMPRRFSPGKSRYPLYRRQCGTEGWSERVRKNLPPTGIWSSDRPARSDSLYRLSYPGPQTLEVVVRKNFFLFENEVCCNWRTVDSVTGHPVDWLLRKMLKADSGPCRGMTLRPQYWWSRSKIIKLRWNGSSVLLAVLRRRAPSLGRGPSH